jgi:flavoprotein
MKCKHCGAKLCEATVTDHNALTATAVEIPMLKCKGCGATEVLP